MTYGGHYCAKCKYDNGKGNDRCGLKGCKIARYALDLINHLQAEVERLKAKCENTQIGYNFAEDEIKNLKKDKYKLQKALNQSEDYRVIAKVEAYKEFAERLKAVYEGFDDKNEVILYSNLLTAIDCLLIGMVGDSNAE